MRTAVQPHWWGLPGLLCTDGRLLLAVVESRGNTQRLGLRCERRFTVGAPLESIPESLGAPDPRDRAVAVAEVGGRVMRPAREQVFKIALVGASNGLAEKR